MEYYSEDLEKEIEVGLDGRRVLKYMWQNIPNNVHWRTSIATLHFPQHQMLHSNPYIASRLCNKRPK